MVQLVICQIVAQGGRDPFTRASSASSHKSE
uniref:Uncharacterized protein n=1 Tax=Anguilla anguilla TaxID=7936 RepID=A0A0E9RPN9_ANGAN